MFIAAEAGISTVLEAGFFHFPPRNGGGIQRPLAACRDLGKAIGGIRIALNHNQPLGNTRFYAKIETAAG